MYNNLAYLYAIQDKQRKADQTYRKSLEIRQRVLRPDHPDIGAVCSNLSDTCWITREGSGSRIALEEGRRDCQEKTIPGETTWPMLCTTLPVSMAKPTGSPGRLTSSNAPGAIWEKIHGPESEIVANSLDLHGQILELAGRQYEATPLFARAEKIRSKPLCRPGRGLVA